MNRQNRVPASARLGGPLKVRVSNAPKFDARQKLKKTQLSPRVKTFDARQKIEQKTKFSDARTKITMKKQEKAKETPSDMRIKINNAKGKSPGNQKAADATQVTVTQHGRILTCAGGGVQNVNGSLVKTLPVSVKTGVQVETGLPMSNSQPMPMSTMSMGNMPMGTMPVGTIRVSNEYYKPPAPAPRVTPRQSPRSRSAPYQPASRPPHQVHHPQTARPASRPVARPAARPAARPPTRQTNPERLPPVRIQVKNEEATSFVPQVLPSHFDEEIKTKPQQESPDKSPVKRYRLLVTNLAGSVSEEDVVELFGATGDITLARMLKQGTAEVVYTDRAHAAAAIRKYHQRELDGEPMSVRLASTKKPGSVQQRLAPAEPPSPPTPSPPPPAPAPAPVPRRNPSPSPKPESSYEPLKLFKPSAKAASARGIDVGAVHKALFKTRDETVSRPVTFTVKI